MNRLLVAVVLTMGAWACGDDDRPDVLPPGEAGRGSLPVAGSPSIAGGASGADDGGAGGETPAAEAGSGGDPSVVPGDESPRVSITSPQPVSDPTSDGVLTEQEVQVTCVALPAEVPGAPAIDPSSVKIAFLDASGAIVKEADGVSTGKPGEYFATLVLPEIESGPVQIRCNANDSAPQPHAGIAVIDSFFDSGPVITIREPARESPHSLRGAIAVEFLVDPAPLADPDPGAALESVALVVQGVPIETTRAGNLYSASLELTDLSKFPVTPTDTVPVGIRATNRRGVEQRLDYNFLVDALGPEIVFNSPAELAVVGGQVPLVFTVTDDKIGVDPDSITLYINEEEHRYDGSASWAPQGNRFTFRYDWAQLRSDISQVVVNVRASDLAGNVAPGASRLFHLDNVPPYISLDPPKVREVERIDGARYTCSPPFDPLFAAVGDEGGTGRDPFDILDEHVLLRAFVFERTNQAAGQSVIFYSGVRSASVRIYVQTDPQGPFLTDVRGDDGRCDDIANIDDLPLLQLTPLDGAGPIVGGDRLVGAPPEQGNYECSDAPASNNDESLCNGYSDMTRVLYDRSEDQALIYAVAPNDDPSSKVCTGVTTQLRPNFTQAEGWICVAAVVEDEVGNRDVSEPIALCMSRDDPSKCPPNEKPTCTDGCDPKFYDPRVPTAEWEIPPLRLE